LVIRSKAPFGRRTRRRLATVVGGCLVVAVAATAFVTRDPAERLAAVEPVRTVRLEERQVSLYVVADWGADTAAESEVAAAMAARARVPGERPDAVLLAGDNFYGSLPSVEDPSWGKLFERMFDPSALGVPFYAVLGNHDYKDGKDAVQLEYARRNPASRWKMPDRWYRLDLPAGRPLATVLMVDSNFSDLTAADRARQDAWFKAELGKPRVAPWLLVCAHHPLFSNGKHGDDPVLQREWGPLLRSAGVDFYVCGHDHNPQHLEVPNLDTSFVVCGGGGASTYEMKRADRGPFAARTYGFLHLRLGDGSADANLLDRSGRPVHAFTRRPSSRAGRTPEPAATMPAAPPLGSPRGLGTS
jgi:tartrate-resistant acid phosphatase type 5